MDLAVGHVAALRKLLTTKDIGKFVFLLLYYLLYFEVITVMVICLHQPVNRSHKHSFIVFLVS